MIGLIVGIDLPALGADIDRALWRVGVGARQRRPDILKPDSVTGKRHRIDVDANGFWKLPEGSVLARTVSLDVWENDAPAPRARRLETQVLHREGGSWRPYSYIWDRDQADATLAEAGGASQTLLVPDGRAPGGFAGLIIGFIGLLVAVLQSYDHFTIPAISPVSSARCGEG